MTKRTHFFIALLILIGIAAFLYFLIIAGGSDNTPTEGDSENPFPDISTDGDIQNAIDFKNGNGVGRFDEPLRPSDPSGVIFDFPVAAFQILPDAGEFGETVYGLEKSTGHIFSSTVARFGESTVSNTTIPRIQKGAFSPDGKHVVMQYLSATNGDVISTFLASLEETATTTTETSLPASDLKLASYELVGSFLPDNVITYAFSPDSTKFFYLVEREDVSEGIELDLDSEQETSLFTTPLQEIDALWHENGILYFKTLPSALAPGYLFELTGGDLVKIMEGSKGFSNVISPNGEKVLFSESSASGIPMLSIWDANSHDSYPLQIETWADKCIWSDDSVMIYCAVPRSIPQGDYPDAWYRGDAQLSDYILSYNINNGVKNLILDPREQDLPEFDAVNLQINTNGSFLLFEDRLSGALITIRL